MSQSGIISATSSTPSIPTSFQTDSGSAVPAANIIQVLGSSVDTDNILGIETTGGTNVVTVELTNRLYMAAPVGVTGAVTGNLITFDLGGAAAVYRLKFDVSGRDTATDDGVGYTVYGSVKTDGATASLIATPFSDADEDASLIGASMTIVVSGNNAILQATGVAGQTINFNAVGTYVVV